MARWLAAASVVWLLLLGSALAARTNDHGSVWAGDLLHRVAHLSPTRGTVVFDGGRLMAGLRPLCRPVPRRAGRGSARAWPPEDPPRRRRAGVADGRGGTGVATLLVEWFGVWPVTNLVRFVAALPLGAVIAMVVVDAPARAGRTESIE